MTPDDGNGEEKGTAKSKSSAPKVEERKYSVEQVLDNARALTGVSRHMAAGALNADGKKSYTAAQARTAVEKFLRSTAE